MRIEGIHKNYPLTSIEAKEHDSKTTTWKTHVLVVLSNVLLAIGMALSAATLFIATMIDPMIAVATPVVPIALGILGLRYAFEQSPQIPSRPLEKGAPMGIVNEGGLDCWLNSAFQLLCHLPSYREKIKKLEQSPTNLNGKTLLQWLVMDPIKTAMDTYVAEESGDITTSISSINSTKLRAAFAKINPEIAETDSEQKDPINIFEAVHSALGDHLPLRQRVQNPGMISETDVNSFFHIDLQLSEKQKKTFNELFNEFFEVTTDTPAIKKWFIKPPEDFLVQIKPGNWEHGMDVKDATKVTEKLDTPMKLKFTKEQCPTEQPDYQVDAFIKHISSVIDSGHYISYIKKEGKWWEINDAIVTQISESKAKEELTKASIVHYSQ